MNREPFTQVRAARGLKQWGREKRQGGKKKRVDKKNGDVQER